jgi:serine/threonine protein kinase
MEVAVLIRRCATCELPCVCVVTHVCVVRCPLHLPSLQNAPKQAAAAASLVLEASALNRLQHPNVVRVYGFCEKPELMVVMEYCAMGSLSQWIRSHRAECMAVRAGRHACPQSLSSCRRCCPC